MTVHTTIDLSHTLWTKLEQQNALGKYFHFYCIHLYVNKGKTFLSLARCHLYNVHVTHRKIILSNAFKLDVSLKEHFLRFYTSFKDAASAIFIANAQL